MSDNMPEDDKDLTGIQNAEEPPKIMEYKGDIPLDKLLADEATTLTPEEKKKIKQVLLGTLGIIVLITALIIFSGRPKEGPMAFGICSTFLEMNTPYPNTLHYNDLEGSRTAIRIYFTNIDPFGEYKLEMIECTFAPDESAGGMKLAQVARNRRPVDADIVKKFNATLPIIMENDPYRILPPKWENQWVMDRKP